MTRRLELGDTFTDVFPIFEIDGVTKHSGATSFVTNLLKEGVSSAIPVTVTEIASTGDYKVCFTPDSIGAWVVQVYNSYDNVWWSTVVEVSFAEVTAEARVSVAFDDSVRRFYMETWLERGNAIVEKPSLVSCEVTLLDRLGNEVFTVDSTSPKDDHHFSLYYDTPLDDDRVYNLIVTIVDSIGEVISYHSFGTVS